MPGLRHQELWIEWNPEHVPPLRSLKCFFRLFKFNCVHLCACGARELKAFFFMAVHTSFVALALSCQLEHINKCIHSGFILHVIG